MWRIKQSLLESIMHASKNVYPDEFISLLAVKNDASLLEELVIVPSEYGEAFSSLRSDLIPFDSRIVGTIHSHPSGKGHPSSEDLNAFSRMGSI
ncbi:MAG: Mov34/MPN/PAD-1 family protein, partial [Candidatus Diapherotrites archaeon]|nr:Mov34/MPN/PAD-1 family protein [Candidatus Diapherotrites archaeon]